MPGHSASSDCRPPRVVTVASVATVLETCTSTGQQQLETRETRGGSLCSSNLPRGNLDVVTLKSLVDDESDGPCHLANLHLQSRHAHTEGIPTSTHHTHSFGQQQQQQQQTQFSITLLVKESQYLATRLFASRLFMRHDTIGRRDENVSKLTRGQQIDDPFFNFVVTDIKARANDTTLVKTTSELNDNLVGTVIIDNFEFTNVTCVSLESAKRVRKNDNRLCECSVQ